MASGTFADFLDSLREFESGVSMARIELHRAEVIDQVGADRFAAFEAGQLTLTDLQYSSTNFVGLVGYQFGESTLVDLGYYSLGATDLDHEIAGQFTGKNGVASLDDLKTNVQEQIVLDEFQLNLDRIENGLAAQGKSLNDFVGETVTVTEPDGSSGTVQLSVTGILAAAHLRGADGVVDILLAGTIAPDEIGATTVRYLQQFGGFDAPAIADLRAGAVAPLHTDATLVIADNAGGISEGDAGPLDLMPGEDTGALAAEAAQPSNDNDLGGILFPEDAPDTASNIFLRLYDPAAGNFGVTGTDVAGGPGYGEIANEAIFTFGQNDTLTPVAGDNFQDLGAGGHHGWGMQGHDVLVGSAGNDILQGGFGADPASDPLVFYSGTGKDAGHTFQVGLDVLDFTDFGEDIALALHEEDGATIVEVSDLGLPDDLAADDLFILLPDDTDGLLSS